jgi:UDP-N-acetylmuramoyl-tripeptide--D-alanyl-D-alanine ligase
MGELARYLRGRLEGGSADAWFEGGVSIDSRTLAPGDLFFAIVGPRHDGHRFVPAALARGASGVVVSESVEAASPAFAVRVEDTTRALQDLASSVRTRDGFQVVGITGSMGKTTTKEAAACAIGSARTVLKSEGNLNNFYGLPLSLLKHRDEDVAVLEMGMSAPGEIARLAEIARPDVGVVTNVAEVHLEFFESVSAIARAKGELYEALGPGATAVVNADDPLVLEQARRFAGRKIRFGIGAPADVRASAIRATPTGLSFTAEWDDDAVEVETVLRGRHNVYNLLAGLAAACALDVPFGEAARALARLTPAPHRGERSTLSAGLTLIDETYNSSPRALRAALEALAEEPGARRIAVLGDMLELGEGAPELHRAAGADVARLSLDRLVGVGPLAKLLVEGACASGLDPGKTGWFESPDEAGAHLASELAPGDVVLFKASRGIALERAIDSLRRALGEKGD